METYENVSIHNILIKTKENNAQHMKNIKEFVKGKITEILGTVGILLEIASIIASWHTLPVVIIISVVLGMGMVWIQRRFNDYKKNAILLSNLYIDDRPMASDIQYLLQSRERSEETKNKLVIDSVKITYNFFCADDKKNVMQTFQWNFRGNNQTKDNIMEFYIVSHRDEISNATQICHRAWDNKNNKKLNIEEQLKDDLFNLKVKFDGNGIPSTQKFDFQIEMKWQEAVKITSCETILIDLDNYTCEQVGNVDVKIRSDVAGFDKRYIEIYSVDRMTLNRKCIYRTFMQENVCGNSEVEFTIPRKSDDRLFMMFIKE